MPMASGAWLAPAPTSLAQAIGVPRMGPFRGWSGRLSLTDQVRWASLLILAFAMLGVGAVVTQQAEASVLNRTAALTALYVDSVLSDQLASLATQPRLSPSEIATLNHLLHETTLSERLVDFRVWSPDGEVLYSSTESLIGQHHPVSDQLARALRGWVVADLSHLDQPENAYLHSRSDTLLEVYAPVRQQDSNGRVLAAIEFYQSPDELLHEILRHAAGRTTTLNEQALRRTGADLHAGPGQALALALLRLDAIHGQCDCGCLVENELEMLRSAVNDAMSDLRAIAAGPPPPPPRPPRGGGGS